MVLPIGSRSGWEEEGVFGCETEKKKSELDGLGRRAKRVVDCGRARAVTSHTHTQRVVDCGRAHAVTSGLSFESMARSSVLKIILFRVIWIQYLRCGGTDEAQLFFPLLNLSCCCLHHLFDLFSGVGEELKNY